MSYRIFASAALAAVLVAATACASPSQMSVEAVGRLPESGGYVMIGDAPPADVTDMVATGLRTRGLRPDMTAPGYAVQLAQARRPMESEIIAASSPETAGTRPRRSRTDMVTLDLSISDMRTGAVEYRARVQMPVRRGAAAQWPALVDGALGTPGGR